MISNFKAAAPPRVQEAVKRTVLRCIGSIQDSLVEDSHRTTGACVRGSSASLPMCPTQLTPRLRILNLNPLHHLTKKIKQASSSRTCSTRRR